MLTSWDAEWGVYENCLKLVQNKKKLNVGFIARVARHNEEENNSETEVKDLNQTFLMSTMKAKIQVSKQISFPKRANNQSIFEGMY